MKLLCADLSISAQKPADCALLVDQEDSPKYNNNTAHETLEMFNQQNLTIHYEVPETRALHGELSNSRSMQFT